MTPSRDSYIGWRCDDCGSIVAGAAAEDADDLAEEFVDDGEVPVSAIGCPVCTWQTVTRPVWVSVAPREEIG